MSEVMLSLRDVHKSFSMAVGTTEVLKGVSLDILCGGTTALVGASGAGKSTLLYLMGGLDRPSSGEVFVDGVAIHGMGEAALAAFRNKTIGFVFQYHHLLPEFSALENITLPALLGGIMREEAVSRAERLLASVGLQHRSHHRPGELSGGEQQRVAIARALVMQPRLLLADEPTGNLDTENSRAIFSLLSDIQMETGVTLVIVTHNNEIAERTGRVVRLHDGRVSTDSMEVM